jgi:hypothetical protein
VAAPAGSGNARAFPLTTRVTRPRTATSTPRSEDSEPGRRRPGAPSGRHEVRQRRFVDVERVWWSSTFDKIAIAIRQRRMGARHPQARRVEAPLDGPPEAPSCGGPPKTGRDCGSGERAAEVSLEEIRRTRGHPLRALIAWGTSRTWCDDASASSRRCRTCSAFTTPPLPPCAPERAALFSPNCATCASCHRDRQVANGRAFAAIPVVYPQVPSVESIEGEKPRASPTRTYVFARIWFAARIPSATRSA